MHRHFNQRKADTRQKIQWGGLIKKAGLDESTAVLLGLLICAKEDLAKEYGAELRELWRLKGDIALTKLDTD